MQLLIMDPKLFVHDRVKCNNGKCTRCLVYGKLSLFYNAVVYLFCLVKFEQRTEKKEIAI